MLTECIKVMYAIRMALTRVTVNLTAKSAKALDDIVTSTGDSQTDTINRALQVYAYFVQLWAEGKEVYVREPGADELTKLVPLI